jgi:hypothetical protein
MKKLMILFATGVMSLSIYGQTVPIETAPLNETRSEIGMHMEKANLDFITRFAPEGCVAFTNGKAMMVKDRNLTELQSDYVLSTGTRITPAGRIIFGDGSSGMMKEGQCVKADGSFFIPNPDDIK